MTDIIERLNLLKAKMEAGEKITIMILGLGSVGTYLLDYIMSEDNQKLHIVVVGRNREKMESDVNIIRISSLIRGKSKAKVSIEGGVDFDNEYQICACFEKYSPDFIVNSSRVYSGLKYGSISWNTIRAYGIWTPLAIKHIRNIMNAYDKAGARAVVINTSYSDAVIPWLKSAGKGYPDFGSGNFNHLIPRIRYAAADMLEVDDFWNVKAVLVTAHFHDVVISKEGHAEGMEQLLKIYYHNKEVKLNQDDIFSRCGIPVPSDAKRNMMNASSNFDIIMSIIKAIGDKRKEMFFSPGAFGNIGGYPVEISGEKNVVKVYIDESYFSLHDMQKANRQSIYLDGIEDISNGSLVYTDELIAKVKNVFHVNLPKIVKYDQIDETAEFIIEQIIQPVLKERKE